MPRLSGRCHRANLPTRLSPPCNMARAFPRHLDRLCGTGRRPRVVATRPMKKALLTIFQVAVTLFVLYLVFRDPARRAQMAEALGTADKGWILIGVLVGSLTYVAGTIRF